MIEGEKERKKERKGSRNVVSCEAELFNQVAHELVLPGPGWHARTVLVPMRNAGSRWDGMEWLGCIAEGTWLGTCLVTGQHVCTKADQLTYLHCCGGLYVLEQLV